MLGRRLCEERPPVLDATCRPRAVVGAVGVPVASVLGAGSRGLTLTEAEPWPVPQDSAPSLFPSFGAPR